MIAGYRFGPFVLDPRRRAVTRDGAVVPVTPKGFDILVYLVQHPNRIVSKQDLMKAVWPDTFVEEGNLTQNISLLRKALGETDDSRLIVTVARQGYQFAGDVVDLESQPPSPDAVPIEAVPVRDVPPMGQRATRTARPRWRRAIAAGAVAFAAIAGLAIGRQHSQASSSSGAPVRLAVLPFANLTGDSTEEYLADGLTEELITQLARLRPEQLGVIARTSVMQYKHGDKPLNEIAKDLSVSYALESSLRRSADRLRVTVQLIRVNDQSHVWASDFEYPEQDAFQIEDSVATAVAREVQLRLTPAQRGDLAHVTTTNAVAVDDVMRGRDLLLLQSGKVTWMEAKRYFDQAIALDSAYALAWVWLSATCRFGVAQNYIPSDSGYPEARFAISRALALDATLPEAWVQLGQLQRLVDWDWEAASASYQHALGLDPGSAEILSHVATIKSELGPVDEAIALERRALVLDPLDPNALLFLGVDYYEADRLGEAAKILESIPPNLRNRFTPRYLVQIYLAQGRVADAANMVEQATDSETQLFTRELVTAQRGPPHAADSVMAVYIDRYHSGSSYWIAELYAFRGEADSAFAWLDRAYAQRNQGVPSTKMDPLFKRVRSDPRFGAFLTKVRLLP